MQLTFLGGAGTVTGSKYLMGIGTRRVLIDCGLYQGYKQLRLLNWEPLPVEPHTIDAVILTHAHLDHSGYLPVLIRNGFKGPVFATRGTRELCGILLPDSGYLQERDAEYANRYGFSKHDPALPLYTEAEAAASLTRFESMDFESERELGDGLSFRFLPAGHILGAAMVCLRNGMTTTLFSGDLGRTAQPTTVDPKIVRQADYLVIESTYGNRIHDPRDPEDLLAEIINRTAGRGGAVLIPSFAVGRAQTLLYHLHRLKLARRIPDLPVFLDSPMAIDASEVLCNHRVEQKLSRSECRAFCAVARYVRTADESKKLDGIRMPMVLISASGMATGGRILHHLKVFAPDARNTILFAGFQAGGTRGASMVDGATSVKIHGGYVPIKAEVHNLHMLSAHADAEEILRWLGNFEAAPRRTFITHGEPAASDALRQKVEEKLRWNCHVPYYREDVHLPPLRTVRDGRVSEK